MLFKVILIGESGVGKTNLFTRFMRNEFKSDTTATIGIEFAIKNYEVKDKIVKVQLWDTGKFLYRKNIDRIWSVRKTAKYTVKYHIMPYTNDIILISAGQERYKAVTRQ